MTAAFFSSQVSVLIVVCLVMITVLVKVLVDDDPRMYMQVWLASCAEFHYHIYIYTKEWEYGTDD